MKYTVYIMYNSLQKSQFVLLLGLGRNFCESNRENFLQKLSDKKALQQLWTKISYYSQAKKSAKYIVCYAKTILKNTVS
jgi:hypothetical protein